jgi:hypothetical protein
MKLEGITRAIAGLFTISRRSQSRPADPLPAGAVAPLITGVAPDGSPAVVDTGTRALHLYFLTSDCAECTEAWRRLSDASDPAGIRGVQKVVVTPGPETESRRRVAQLSVGSVQLSVVMSSRAWHDFGIAKAPWSVEIAGGVISASEPWT